MRPASSQKLPRSPIFSASKVALPRFAAKDGKLRLVFARQAARRLLQPDEIASCCGKLARGVIGGSSPVGRESVTPPQNRDPPRDPPFSHQPEVPLTCMDPCIFAALDRRGPKPRLWRRRKHGDLQMRATPPFRTIQVGPKDLPVPSGAS
jgi:hypothetical protein